MKTKKTFAIVGMLMLIVALTACASDKTAEVEETTATLEDEALPVFTADTLAEFNGKDGKAAYVAYEGKVYDVSEIAAWKEGIHQGRFEAGKDYTDVLNNEAPHKPTNLTDNAPIVGLFE